jgi:hypothetical protein
MQESITTPQARAPSTLQRAAIIVATILALGFLLALWPFMHSFGLLLARAVEEYPGLLLAALGIFSAGLLLAGLRFAFAWSWKADASARQARIVRMQNDLPIDVNDTRATLAQYGASSIQQHYAVQLAEAERLTPLLTSQNLHMHNTALPAPAPELPGAQHSAIEIPTFAQLLDRGMFGRGKPLLLGYQADTGIPVTGDWRDLYSCGIGAQQGAGKTWLLAFLLAQSAAAGGRLIICDLHAGDEESLANRIGALAPAFMCDIASTPKEIESAFAFADDKLERRKLNNARWPIVLVADEWTSLLRTSAGGALPAHIQNIAEQGRKYNINGLLAAQAWTKAASSDVRNQLTSHYVMRQRVEEARYQLGMRADQLPADIRSLPDATGYLLNVRGDLVKIIIPKMTASDIARCGEMIPNPASSPAKFGFAAPTARLPGDSGGTATGQQPDASAAMPASAPQRAPAASPEAARAAALFQAGKSIAGIVEELRGISSSTGGRAYRTAREEIEALVRKGIQS